MVQDKRYSYNGGLIESHTWFIKLCHFKCERLQTLILRSGHSLTLNISEMAIVTMEGKSETVPKL